MAENEKIEEQEVIVEEKKTDGIATGVAGYLKENWWRIPVYAGIAVLSFCGGLMAGSRGQSVVEQPDTQESAPFDLDAGTEL